MKTLTVPGIGKIKDVIPESSEIVTLTIECDDLTDAAPGQFNMLGIRGIGEAPISCSGTKHSLAMHTIRKAGNVTQALASLQSGDEITIRGPFGKPWPLERALGQDLLVVAGGIGIAAVRSAIEYAVKHRRDFHRVSLLYGSHTPAELIYLQDLELWSTQQIQIEKIVDLVPDGQRWLGPTGLVTSLLAEADVDFSRTVSLVCGPEIMIRFVAKSLIGSGQKADDIFVSLERRMRCGFGQCGHCMIGQYYVCKDGPVFSYPDISKCSDVFL